MGDTIKLLENYGGKSRYNWENILLCEAYKTVYKSFLALLKTMSVFIRTPLG